MNRNTLQCLLIVAVTACLIGETTRADDWPQWLGPQRDSVWRESGIMDVFPDTGPRLRWRQEVGVGYSGPAVAQGRVFVADFVTGEIPYPSASRRDKLEGTERVVCLAVETGKSPVDERVPWHLQHLVSIRTTRDTNGRWRPRLHTGSDG